MYLCGNHAMLSINFKAGGGAVLDRIIQAYGFDTKIEYCKHLGITASNLSMRYKRDLYPSDLVVKCLADTGVRLEWLAGGQGDMFAGPNARNQSQQQTLEVPASNLIKGEIYDAGTFYLDIGWFKPDRDIPARPGVLLAGSKRFIVDYQFSDVSDGRWLTEIEGRLLIRDLFRIPIGRVKVCGGEMPFDCDLQDIRILARVITSCV